MSELSAIPVRFKDDTYGVRVDLSGRKVFLDIGGNSHDYPIKFETAGEVRSIARKFNDRNDFGEPIGWEDE